MILQAVSAEQQLLIQKICNEDVNRRDQDLQAIKEWLKKQPHLPDSWDDEIIMNFLRDARFSLEKTKKKLDKYFTVRTMFPEFFTNRDLRSKEMQNVFNHIQMVIMPNMTSECHRVYIGRFVTSDEDVTLRDVVNLIKIVFMLGDIIPKTDKIGVAGNIIIVDVGELSWKHIRPVNATVAKNFLLCGLQAFPFKIKEVHLLRVTPVMDYLLKILGHVLNEKIWKRIRSHQDVETLYDYVPKEILPEEFGGLNGKMQKNQLIDICLENSFWFKERENVKVDESKRPKQCSWLDELFGTVGSFRQLTID